MTLIITAMAGSLHPSVSYYIPEAIMSIQSTQKFRPRTIQSTRSIFKGLTVTGVVLALATWGAPSLMAHGGASSYQASPVRPAAMLDDPTIVAIFDAANTWDIETGNLAKRRGATKDVRDFGAMLVRDHHIVRQQGRDLAKKLGVHPTPTKNFPLSADHTAAM